MTTRRKIALTLRKAVRLRARGRCEYCLAPEAFSLDSFTIDHIQPVTAEGSDALDNLAFACHNCNNRKQNDMAALDPETGRVTALYHPRRDVWSAHFRWSEDALTIEPLTATGRTTILRLQLNRTGAINVRRALLALGEEHPAVP